MQGLNSQILSASHHLERTEICSTWNVEDRREKQGKAGENMKIYPVGDMALSVDFGNVISEKVNEEVMQLEHTLQEEKIPGILEMLPSYRALLVRYDPAQLSYALLSEKIGKAQGEKGSGENHSSRKIIRLIPCCYGGKYGEDLKGMEALTGLSEKEIIEIHSGTDYKIYMLGFLPGFVYLGGMDERIAAPRLDVPRVVIPAGSVGIGGKQTGVYPIASPGGWRLIGSTPVRFYNPSAEKPILCSAGEYIRFVPVSESSYEKIAADVAAGTYRAEIANS